MVPPVGLPELHMDPPDPLPYPREQPRARRASCRPQAIDDFVAGQRPRLGLAARSERGAASPRRRPRCTGAAPRRRRDAARLVCDVRGRDRAQTRPPHTWSSPPMPSASPTRSGPTRPRYYSNFAEEDAGAARFFCDETWNRLPAPSRPTSIPERFLPRDASDPARGSDVKTGSHGGGETHLAPTTQRAPPVARSARVSPVLHHQRTTRRGE